MRKSSARTRRYRAGTSQRAGSLASLREQMADFARGERLRELRQALHLSQEDFAHEVGVTAKTVRTWEHGGKIKWPNAKNVARFVGVDPEELVEREPVGSAPSLPPPAVTGTQLDRIEQKLDLILSALRELDEEGLERDADDLDRLDERDDDRTDEGQAGSGHGG